MALNIDKKVENEGKNEQGRLSANEFNQLVDVVKSLENNNVDGLQTKLNIINSTLEELLNGSSGGVQRNVLVQNNLDSRNLSASKGESCYLKFTFVSQERYDSGEAYEDTGERGVCLISVNGGCARSALKTLLMQSLLL